MDYDEIYDALNARVNSLSPAWDTSWPNTKFDQTGLDKWQAVSHLPMGPTPLGPGADAVKRYAGILQLDLYTPINEGEQEALGRINEVLAHFPRGQEVSNGGSTVTITKVEIAAPMYEGQWRRQPLSIYWERYI